VCNTLRFASQLIVSWACATIGFPIFFLLYAVALQYEWLIPAKQERDGPGMHQFGTAPVKSVGFSDVQQLAQQKAAAATVATASSGSGSSGRLRRLSASRVAPLIAAVYHKATGSADITTRPISVKPGESAGSLGGASSYGSGAPAYAVGAGHSLPSDSHTANEAGDTASGKFPHTARSAAEDPQLLTFPHEGATLPLAVMQLGVTTGSRAADSGGILSAVRSTGRRLSSSASSALGLFASRSRSGSNQSNAEPSLTLAQAVPGLHTRRGSTRSTNTSGTRVRRASSSGSSGDSVESDLDHERRAEQVAQSAIPDDQDEVVIDLGTAQELPIH
jgi:hypothetical protein